MVAVIDSRTMVPVFRCCLMMLLFCTCLSNAFAGSEPAMVKAWEGHYQAEINSNTDNLPGSAVDEHRSITARIILNKRETEEDLVIWKGTASCTASLKRHEASLVIPGTPMRTDVDVVDSRIYETPAMLQMNTEDGDYFVDLCDYEYEVKSNVTSVQPNEAGAYSTIHTTGTADENPMAVTGVTITPAGVVPDQGNHLSGGYDLAGKPAGDGGAESAKLDDIIKSAFQGLNMKVSGHVSWSLMPQGAIEPAPILAYAKKGDEWVPEDDNKVEVELSWDEGINPSEVRFTLFDISEEPGINLNSEDRNTDPDLELSKENMARQYQITQSGKTFIATKNEPSSNKEKLIIHAKDFGAFGKLKAEIKVNGQWYEASAKEFDKPSLPVPYDKNENMIADKWEKDVGIFGKNLSANWDEDPYPGNQYGDGDGFTLYEEYRGFRETGHVFRKADNEQVKNGHVRMDPMYKDVFIYDRDGLFLKYYKPYNPANLNWHLIDLSMMKRSGTVKTHSDYRWVNFNTSRKYFYRNQYAIYIENGHVSHDPDAPNGQGQAQELELYQVLGCDTVAGNFSFPLKCWAKVSIYPEGIHNFISKNYNNLGLEMYTERVAKEMLGNSVVHEIGHTLGITHHREPKVKEFTDKGKTVGVSSCAMRYDTAEEMRHPERFNYNRTRYCKEGEVFIIADETDTDGNFRKYQSHNCYGQINIKGE